MAHHDGRAAAVGLTVDADALRPLVEAIVREVVGQLENNREAAGDKLAYSEEEAARLLSIRPHVLRDERLRGRIAASSIVGRRVRYLRSDLLSYMGARRKATGNLAA